MRWKHKQTWRSEFFSHCLGRVRLPIRFETKAEYGYVRAIGGDAVGMSTVPEVIAAHHMSIPCFAVSIITDLGVPGKIEFTTHTDVQRVAADSEPKMTLILKELISSL